MKTNCPSKIVLEGFLAGEKMPDELRGHVEGCPACGDRVRQWKEEKEIFLQKYPFQRLWNSLEGRKRRFRFWEKFLFPVPLRASLALAALAGLIFVTVVYQNRSPVILSKGGVGLGFYVSHAGHVEKGRDGMTLSAGDDLQFVYAAKHEQFLLLLGAEANGKISVYYPLGGTTSGPAASGGTRRLPNAIRWQPESSYERFFAVFSETPVSLQMLEAALRQVRDEGKSVEETTRLPLPLPQSSVLVYQKPRG